MKIPYLVLSLLSFSCSAYSSPPLFNSYFALEFGGGNIQLNDFKYSSVKMDFSEDVLIAKLRYQYSPQVSLAFSTANHVSCYSCGGISTDDNDGWREIDYRSSFYQFEAQYSYAIYDYLDLNLIAGVNYSDEEFDVQECQSGEYEIDGELFRFCSGGSKVDELSGKEDKYSAMVGVGGTLHFSKSWSVQSNYKYSQHREGLGIFELTMAYKFQ